MAAAGGEKTGGLPFLGDLTSSAGKMWEDKVGEASKALDSQLEGVASAASAALDSGLGAVSGAVRGGVAAAAGEVSAAKARASQFWETGAAHYAAAEQQAFDVLKRGVRTLTHDYPEASVAGGVAAAALLLPGPRKFLLRKLISSFRSEEAMYRSAEQRYLALQGRVEGQQGDLLKLQDQLQQAKAEYARGLARLKSSAGALQSLGSRVQSSEKAAKALVDDLRQLPSQAAVQLRSDAAVVAASAKVQRAALDKALQRVAKDYGI